MNSTLRAALYELVYVAPASRSQLERVEKILDKSRRELPELLRDECRDHLAQIEENKANISARTKLAKV